MHPETLVVFIPRGSSDAKREEAREQTATVTGVPAARVNVIADDPVGTTAWRHYPTLTEWRAAPLPPGSRPPFILMDAAGVVSERPPGSPWRDHPDGSHGDCEADDAREPLAEELVPEQPDVDDDFRGVGSF